MRRTRCAQPRCLVVVESPPSVPETLSTFHRRAQRNAFRRRCLRQQPRLFAIRINGRDPAQAPSGFAEPVSDDFPILHRRKWRCRDLAMVGKPVLPSRKLLSVTLPPCKYHRSVDLISYILPFGRCGITDRTRPATRLSSRSLTVAHMMR